MSFVSGTFKLQNNFANEINYIKRSLIENQKEYIYIFFFLLIIYTVLYNCRKICFDFNIQCKGTELISTPNTFQIIRIMKPCMHCNMYKGWNRGIRFVRSSPSVFSRFDQSVLCWLFTRLRLFTSLIRYYLLVPYRPQFTKARFSR